MIQNENCLYQSKYGEFYMEYTYSADESAAFQIFVKSYGFTGLHEFCMRNEQIISNISLLKALDDSLHGSCKLVDIDSNAYICLEFTNKSLKVCGQLGGNYEENYMKFSFLADQTLIKLLVNKLSESLNN